MDTDRRSIHRWRPGRMVIQSSISLNLRMASKFIIALDQGTTDKLYNLANTGGTTSPTTAGFLVDNDGYIQYPRIGKIKAEGLTKPQLSEEIKKSVTGPLTKSIG